LFFLATLLASGLFIFTNLWRADAAATEAARESLEGRARARIELPANGHQRVSTRRPPGPAIEPYVRPEFAAEMHGLRKTILEAAQRHNQPELSGMSDRDFAVLIALIMYNEHFGWFEERLAPVQAFTPFYEDLQRHTNATGLSNLSVWPANIRPSVALEILRRQVPLPVGDAMVTVPITVSGSFIRLERYDSQGALYAAITTEITNPELAVEYLAANLERGIYRAHYEGSPVTWRALAAWHNQGVVSAEDIRNNPTASDYVRRASAYFGKAEGLIDMRPPRIPPSKYTLFIE
jgi:hypothetical protein